MPCDVIGTAMEFLGGAAMMQQSSPDYTFDSVFVWPDFQKKWGYSHLLEPVLSEAGVRDRVRWWFIPR